MHGGSLDDTGGGPTKRLHSRNQMTKQNYETCAAGTIQRRSLAWANLSEGSFRIRAQNLKNWGRGLKRGGPNTAPRKFRKQFGQFEKQLLPSQTKKILARFSGQLMLVTAYVLWAILFFHPNKSCHSVKLPPCMRPWKSLLKTLERGHFLQQYFDEGER